MKRSVKETAVRLLILLIGLTVAHFGVTLFILAAQGTDPFNVLVQGVFRSLNGIIDHPLLTHGNIHMVLCLLIVAALLLIDRKYIKIGTVVCMAAGGPIIDLFTLLLSPLFPDKPSLWLAIPMLIVACGILAFGMTIVIQSDAGTGPNDLVSVVTADKLKKKFSIVRIIIDALFVLTGWLLGGGVGLGTIVCVALVGSLAGLFLPVNGKWIDRMIGKL